MGSLTKKVTVKADQTTKDHEHFIYCPYIPCVYLQHMIPNHLIKNTIQSKK